MNSTWQTPQNPARNQMAKGGAFPCIVNIWPTTSLSGTPATDRRGDAGSSLRTRLVESSDVTTQDTNSFTSTTSAYHVDDAQVTGASCLTSPASSIRMPTDDGPTGKASELQSTILMSPLARKPTSRLSAALKAQSYISTGSTSSLPSHAHQLCSPAVTNTTANTTCVVVLSECAPPALGLFSGAPGAARGPAGHNAQRQQRATSKPPPTSLSQKLPPTPAPPPPTTGPTPPTDVEALPGAPAVSAADSVSEVWDSLPCFSPSVVDRLWAGRAGSSSSNSSPPALIMYIRRGGGVSRDAGHVPGPMVAASLPVHKTHHQQQPMLRNRTVHNRPSALQHQPCSQQQEQQSALLTTPHQQHQHEHQEVQVISGSANAVVVREACDDTGGATLVGPILPMGSKRQEEDIADAIEQELGANDRTGSFAGTPAGVVVCVQQPPQQQPVAEIKSPYVMQGGSLQSPAPGSAQQSTQSPVVLQQSLRDSDTASMCLAFVAAAAAAAPAPRALGAACSPQDPQNETGRGSHGGNKTWVVEQKSHVAVASMASLLDVRVPTPMLRGGRPLSCGAAAGTATADLGLCGGYANGTYSTSHISNDSKDLDPVPPSGCTGGSPTAARCHNGESPAGGMGGGGSGSVTRTGHDMRTQWWGASGFFSEERTTGAKVSRSSQQRLEVEVVPGGAVAVYSRVEDGAERREGHGVGGRGAIGRGGASGMSRVRWLR